MRRGSEGGGPELQAVFTRCEGVVKEGGPELLAVAEPSKRKDRSLAKARCSEGLLARTWVTPVGRLREKNPSASA